MGNSCPCGHVILADTEDWEIPLCCDCYYKMRGRFMDELLQELKAEKRKRTLYQSSRVREKQYDKRANENTN